LEPEPEPKTFRNQSWRQNPLNTRAGA